MHKKTHTHWRNYERPFIEKKGLLFAASFADTLGGFDVYVIQQFSRLLISMCYASGEKDELLS